MEEIGITLAVRTKVSVFRYKNIAGITLFEYIAT